MERNLSNVAKLPSLPVELLLYIISFLTENRDKVKLRYVSRRFLHISETASLWRKFVWPYYDFREGECLCNFFKHSITSQLNYQAIKNSHGEHENLQYLDVQLPVSHSLLRISARLKELTVRVKGGLILETINNWMVEMFAPPKLNLVVSTWGHPVMMHLFNAWSEWNSHIRDGHTACLKIYKGLITAPKDLSCQLPVCQLQYGNKATLPLVKFSEFGLLGLRSDTLFLTDCDNGSYRMHRAEIIEAHHVRLLNPQVTNLAFVTHMNLSSCDLCSGNLEQLAIACPNLLQLNLQSNHQSLSQLDGLQKIAKCCPNLEGLNLIGIHVNWQIQFWEILSETKLTHLAIELCVVSMFNEKESDQKHIINLFKKFSRLQALEGSCGLFCQTCRYDNSISSLSYFPSLMYCILHYCDGIEDVFTGCNKLKYLVCNSGCALSLSSAVHNSNLQQLYIGCNGIVLDDTFMDTVSAHGGLTHVVLCVYSVTAGGITSLIANSPKLLTLRIVTIKPLCDEQHERINLTEFKADLKGSFSSRKLFALNRYQVMHDDFEDYEVKTFLDETDIYPLWK